MGQPRFQVRGRRPDGDRRAALSAAPSRFVRLRPRWSRPGWQTSPGTTQHITARLDPAGSLMVTATDEATGAGVDEACPWIAPQDIGDEVPCSGPDGRRLINDLGPYAWPVEVADYSGAHAWQWSGDVAGRANATPVVVTPGTTTDVSVHLPTAAKITGTITGATRPSQYTTVYAVDAITGDVAGPAPYIRPDYTFTLGGLATQDVRIAFNADFREDFAWYPQPVHVTEGSTAHVDLVVPSS